MRKPIIAGNWKMNKTLDEAVSFVEAIPQSVKNETKVEMIVCANFTALDRLSSALADSNIGLGAQNIYWEDSGAYTGETSASMLNSVGCKYAVIGHSERREYFGDNDVSVNLKVKKTMESNLIPIMCVGETLNQRESGQTDDLIKTQVELGLKGVNLTLANIEKFIVAYEPVWAIGTGKTCESNEANRVISLIRNTVSKIYNNDIASKLRILYGGSVKPSNVAELLSKSDIDGGLVGGASLKPDSFSDLVKNSI